MVLPTQWDGLTQLALLSSWYERQTVQICRRLLTPGMNAVDVGANVGYYTRIFAEQVRPSGVVYAFEAHPENFRMLCENTRSVRNVAAVQQVVSDREGMAELYEMTDPGRHSLFRIPISEIGVTVRKTLSVVSTTLDAYLEAQGRPTIHLIKLDIEGSEPLALAGMEETIARSPQLALVVEYYPRVLQAVGTDASGFLARLRALGFGLLTIEASPEAVTTLACDTTNLLCLKGWPREPWLARWESSRCVS